LTAAELQTTLRVLGWNVRELARQLGIGRARAWDWHSGKTPVPAPVADWLRMLVRFLAASPPPALPERARPQRRRRSD
jgi:hypothetical protein